MYNVHVHVHVYTMYMYMYANMSRMQYCIPNSLLCLFSEKTENAVTPFLISSTIAGKLSAKPPHQPHNGTHNEINTAINNRDNSGVKESGSKVVAKGGLSKQTGSKVATKATKGNKTNSSKVQRSKGTFTAVKCTVVAGQRGKAGSRSKKVLPNKTAAKKGTCTFTCTFVL